MEKNKKGNITIKVFSVLIAIIMWFYVMSEINPVTPKEFTNVRVDFKNMESVEQSNLYVLDPKEVEVNVKISGRRNDVLQITQGDIKPYIDLRGTTEGEVRVPIYINSPSKIEIEDYSPKEVIFKIENIIAKEKQVELRMAGTVANGYATGKIELKPSSVIIRGPRSLVNTVSKVVATVDVTNLKEGVTVNLPYKILDDREKEVSLVQKEPDSINVTIPVYKVKNVNIAPEIVGVALEGYKITGIKVTPQNVKIMGSEEAINAISSIKTTPIDISSLTQNYLVNADLIIPEGILLSGSDEKPVVSIQIEPIIEKTFEYTVKDATFINMNENLELVYPESSGKITITINGIKSIMNGITRRNITPYIDFKGLEEGQHDLEIKALIEDGVEVQDISPNTISIVLRKTLEDGSTNSQVED